MGPSGLMEVSNGFCESAVNKMTVRNGQERFPMAGSDQV